MAAIKDYEDVSLCPVSDQVRDEMFSLQERMLGGLEQEGRVACGVLHRFVWHDDAIWVT